MSLSVLYYVFDEVIEEVPSTYHLISSTTSIICDKSFESGLVQLHQGLSSELKYMEQCSVSKFAKSITVSNDGVSQTEPEYILLRACKRQKRDLLKNVAGYQYVGRVLPTSNICERLFSRAIYAMNRHHMALLNVSFECHMLLCAN